ncbi:hypothetical protein HPP92_006248 [Vanilla planifolia]|uniref:Uncharacterized protein n=1 Tax=Vanilla planifolia TaxID=51239 RepID=A0A835VDD4_VANPL|nr:hypothetical protein HPP92_006248 [Vanilla planifolia]
MQKRTRVLVSAREGRPAGDPFPSMIIGADGIYSKGSYAEAQVKFLFPDELMIKELVNVLKEKKIELLHTFTWTQKFRASSLLHRSCGLTSTFPIR